MRVNPNYSADMVNLLQQSQQAETTALQQMSTGRKVSMPSDGPASEAAMIDENSRSASADQYNANSESLKEVLSTADGTLNSVVTLLQRASTLGVEGASTGTLNQSDLDSIANEVQGISSEMLSLANSSYAGQYVFAGTATSAAPYVADATTGDVTYVGNDQQNNVQIGTGLSVSANLPGSSLFSQTGANVFTALQTMISALKSGSSTDISGAVTLVGTALNAVDSARVFYGNTINELTSNESYLGQEKVNIASYQNTLVGADPAAAVTAVQQAEYARNATVAASAKMNQVSLLDYLK